MNPSANNVSSEGDSLLKNYEELKRKAESSEEQLKSEV